MSEHSYESSEYDFSPPTKEYPFVLNNRWEVVDKLGQGGMGTVYMARDRNLRTLGQKKKSCVVKELRDDFYKEEEKEKAQEFFLREQSVLASLDHPNIVRVLDHFSTNGKFYLVMEYVEGMNLHEMLTKRGEPFPEDIVLQWSVQICDVLDYLHNHDPPVIYRDLKPSNVMIDSKDQVKLVDFGIARPFEDVEDNTNVVSQGYSPPEQYWGAADRRSDVYALGATIYYLLTGQDPLALQVACPRTTNPEVSEHLDDVVQLATQQDPKARYGSALEMKDALLYRPLEDAPDRKKTFITVGVVVAIVGIFFSLLVFSAGLHEDLEKKAISARTYEEQSAQKADMEESAKRLEKARKALLQELGSTSSADTTENSPTAAGQSNWSQAQDMPLFEVTNEIKLTDPETF